MKTVYCKCGCGQEIEDGNIYIHGHNRRGLPSHVIPEDKWSMEYDECIECGTTKISYGGRGLCKKCYKKFFYETSKTKEKWSLKYNCCIDCGRIDRPYHANGRCVTCDSNYRNRFGTVVYYDSINNGKVRFRSKLERAYAGYLDVSGISWVYEPDSFPYLDTKDKRRTYTPDFYLTETEEYIEIKGYDRGDTDYKIDKMKEIGIAIKVVRNRDFQHIN